MLDEYSQQQWNNLAELRRDWLPYFSEYPYEGRDESYLLVKIPSAGSAAEFLILYTADGEITVSFGVWECHFDEYTSAEQGGLGAAIAEIGRIQNDEVVAVSFWRAGQWLGSHLVSPSERVFVPEFVVGAESAKIVSWSGRLSREVAL